MMKSSTFLSQPAARFVSTSVSVFLMVLCISGLSEASLYSMTSINGTQSGLSAAQFTVDVQDYSASQVLLVFANNSIPLAVDCSIKDIYVQQSLISFDSFVGLQDGSIEFSAKTGKLPGGGAFGFTNDDFCAAADPAAPKKGLNVGESLGLLFNLNGSPYADINSAIGTGNLRVGLHVISMNGSGGTGGDITLGGPSFIVPEPAAVVLLGLGGVGLGLYRRKR